MQLKIMTFAQLREQLGAVLNLDLPDGATVADLQALLQTRHPDNQALRASRMAVNRSYVIDPSLVLTASDEIALIPPVSGG